jgi:hypothetical protein
MPTEDLVLFLQGATSMACMALSVFFLRFWRRSRDRLFAMFSLAFLVFALNRALLVALDAGAEAEAVIYGGRAIAFGLILLAILDKNRKRG